MTYTAWGLDFSYGNGLTVAQLKAKGISFVCRYLAPLPNGKVISRAEAQNYISGGIGLVYVWESTGTDQTGVADAREADRQVGILGTPGAVIYFARDWDVSPGQEPGVESYLAEAGSVVGKERTGLYGGYWPVKTAFDKGVCTYGWQTYAWSAGNWDARAQLQQYQNGVTFGPAQVDRDRATSHDYGQWPRPSMTNYRHVAGAGIPAGSSLDMWADAHACTVHAIIALTEHPGTTITLDHLAAFRAYIAKGWGTPMPDGLVFYAPVR